MNYSLSEIAQIVGGKLTGKDNLIENIIFDSRNIFNKYNSLFIAIKGDMFDGHNFIESMIDKDIKSFIVDTKFNITQQEEIGYIEVDNTLDALQKLAKYHRAQLPYQITAITGSNGKSIIKEWIYQILTEYTVFRSPMSYNSQLGVALSLLMTTGDEDMAIIEAGISKKEEMKRLWEMIQPDIVIFTTLGEAHSENFTSLEEKLNEKLELIKDCKKIIYNSDNELITKEIENRIQKENRFSWGTNKNSDIIINRSEEYDIEFSYQNESYYISLPTNDIASRENIMHVISFAALIGADLSKICKRAEKIHPVAMRLELISGIGGAKIINDSYNSDYNSLGVALSYMRSISTGAEKIVIISDILQSGRENDTLYDDVAKLLNESKASKVIAIGEKVGNGILKKFNGSVEKYSSTDEFIRNIKKEEYNNKTVLIKGSRVFEFEKISALLEDKQHSTVMEVNIDALLHNYRYYKSKIAPTTKTVAMVKAMSYGSGSYEIALTLQNSGINYLAVAYIDEGVTLRQKGIHLPIITLNSNPKDYDVMIENRLEPEIYSIYSLNLFIESCNRLGIEHYPIHLKMDTGMHRMGFEENKLDELKSILDNNKAVRVSSIFSHFSCSDTPSQDDETRKQIALYEVMSKKLMQEGTIRHICNSAGTERFPEAHFDMVRLGLGLYGISAIDSSKLENVNSLHTRILQIKEIKKGDYVGYNMRSIAEKDMKIATLSIGYADGFNRKFGCGKWSLKIGTKHAPTIGNISMDTCSIDITGINAQEGDRVSVFTSSKELVEMADIIGTIPYEILTSISTRIKRIYIRK